MITYTIRYAEDADQDLWDAYVRSHAEASLYHLFGWRNVIRATYGHKTYYLMLVSSGQDRGVVAQDGGASVERVLGVLPVCHLKSVLFGNALVSLPFVDGGGLLADSSEVVDHLLQEVVRLGHQVGASRIELRQEGYLAAFDEKDAIRDQIRQTSLKLSTKSDKVRMLLNLPDSGETLMKSFKSKLRSQISKPVKAGLTAKTGGMELLEDFYRVFVVNMRDLGSPVHSVKLMRQVLGEFSADSAIVAVYKDQEPVAAALLVGSGKVMRNPWASSLRSFASLSPNMLLYFRMFEYACEKGYGAFDFGRSTPGEGTYRFKEQWGAVPAPLYWHYISLDGSVTNLKGDGKGKFETATRYWKRLPLIVSRVIGPSIRKHISL